MAPVDKPDIGQWQELVRQENQPEKLANQLAALQPFDIAEILQELEFADSLVLAGRLPSELGAASLEYLEPALCYRILRHLPDRQAANLLMQMSGDAIVDLLRAIHPKQAEIVTAWLPEEHRAPIATLLTFPEGTAGSLATSNYIAVREGWVVGQTLEHVRKIGSRAEVVSYIYVVNSRGQLVGVVSLRDLIFTAADTPLHNLVSTNVISVQADADQDEAAHLLTQYDFVALPVVDAQRRLIGVVTVDDLVDVIERSATEDIQKMGGSRPLEDTYLNTSIKTLFHKRVGWLLLLFLAEAYTGTVLRHYESTLSEAVGLAFFIPLLIGTGGNTGSQVVATLVRSLAVGDVQFRDMLRVLLRELATGALLGLMMGTAALLRAFTLGVGTSLGPVVAVTALFIVIWASTVAAVLPLVLHHFKVDPAVVSGPFITTIVDGTGLIIYFTLARFILGLD